MFILNDTKEKKCNINLHNIAKVYFNGWDSKSPGKYLLILEASQNMNLLICNLRKLKDDTGF